MGPHYATPLNSDWNACRKDEMRRQLKRTTTTVAQWGLGEEGAHAPWLAVKKWLIFAHFKWKLFGIRRMEIASRVSTQSRRQLWYFTVVSCN